MTPERRKTTLLQSFNHAFQGLVYSVRHQRNMRIHMAVALIVLVASIFLNVSRLELVIIFATIAFVMMAELMNTAIEALVDIVTEEYDPRAKVAKDLAAGAVLIAAINALVVAYLVLADRLANVSLELLGVIRRSPAHLTIVALALVALVVVVVKATRAKGTPLTGGLPSGHAAVAFAGWTAVTFVIGATPQGLLVSAITFVIAALVAQSRVETGVHSLLEVVLGALLGIAATTLIFQLWF
jgi:diacylglycerol kinase (ATP)